VLKIVLIKDKIARAAEEIKALDSSFYCEVVLKKEGTDPTPGVKCTFLEILDKKINLKDQLDTLKIVENAADLNLKLMKWRQVPTLQLEVLQKTSCLMLGSGSLGC